MNFCIVAAAAFLVLNFAGPAHAYLDPGSGSMFLQLLLGGVAGLMLAIKIFWRRILSMFGIGKKDEKVDQPPDQIR